MKNELRSYLLILLLTPNLSLMSMEELPSEQPSNQQRSGKYVIGYWPGGMGICITSVLNHLSYCDYYGLTPVVHWAGGLYNNPHGFNNKYNEWEYYFNPVSNLSYAPRDPINQYSGAGEGWAQFTYYDMSQEKRNFAEALISKYVHPNTIVQSKINQFYNTHMAGKNTIGIHLRGTDKNIEEKTVPPEVIVAEALKYANEDTQFFLATDEKRLLDAMIRLLNGRKVISYDCYRSETGAPLHVHKRPSFAQVGEDVIVEMWIMSKCDILIHTLSNVSSIPLYINSKLPHVTMR